MLSMEYSKQLSKKQSGKIEKNVKVAYGIFEILPSRRSDYLTANDVEKRSDDNSFTVLFLLTFCDHCWPENKKGLSRFLEKKGKLETFLGNTRTK